MPSACYLNNMKVTETNELSPIKKPKGLVKLTPQQDNILKYLDH